MNVAELFKAMGNSVDRVHLLRADGGPHPSSLGTYTFDENRRSDGNAWAVLDTENGIPERYHSCKVTAFYLYEGSDGGTVIDIGISISKYEEEEG